MTPGACSGRGDSAEDCRLTGGDGVGGGRVQREPQEKEAGEGGMPRDLAGKMRLAGFAVLRQVEGGTLVQRKAAASRRNNATRKNATRRIKRQRLGIY